MRVLLTRPADDNARIACRLARLGAQCLGWPLTRIVPLVARLDVPEGAKAILFTSANGVRAFAAASPERGLPALCVGDRTAECAREAGFEEVSSAGSDAAGLARLVRASGYRRLFHPRGRYAGDLAPLLPEAHVKAVAVYAAEPGGPPPAEVERAFGAGDVGLVTVWSPRNAAILRDWIASHRPALGSTDLVAISEAAADPLRQAGFRGVLVADRPDAEGMIERVATALRQ